MTWATNVLQWPRTKSSEAATWSETQKIGLSSDRSLQLDSLKLESLVIASQQIAVNTFPGFVHTARQTTRVCNTRSRWPLGEPSKVGQMIGVKS